MELTDFVDLYEEVLNESYTDIEKGGYQKDWIISSGDGNLFCLTIASKDGNKWKLIEWVNFHGMSNVTLLKMVNMGYMTMLEAMKNQKSYEYVIGKHIFSKNAVDNEYFRGLLKGHDDKFYNKVTLSVDIDKAEFDREVLKLVPKHNYEYNKKK